MISEELGWVMILGVVGRVMISGRLGWVMILGGLGWVMNLGGNNFGRAGVGDAFGMVGMGNDFGMLGLCQTHPCHSPLRTSHSEALPVLHKNSENKTPKKPPKHPNTTNYNSTINKLRRAELGRRMCSVPAIPGGNTNSSELQQQLVSAEISAAALVCLLSAAAAYPAHFPLNSRENGLELMF